MSWNNQPICPCTAEITQLSALLPTPGPFEVSILTTLTSPLGELLKCIEQCKQQHPTSSTASTHIQNENPEPDHGLVPLAESILGICHAACVTYELIGNEPNGHASTSTGTADASIRNSGIGASIAVAPNSATFPQSSISTWRCTKTPMTLGSLTLQDEEESLLARQIVCTVLTTLSALLRVVYIQDKANQGHPVNPGGGNDYSRPPLGTLYGREGIGAVSQCLSGVLALLGKIASE